MENNQPPDPNMACGPNLWPPYPEPWRAPYQWYGPYVPSPGNGATASATWNMPWPPPPPPPPPPTPGNYHQAANVSHYQSNEQHYHTTTYGQHPVSPLDPTPSFKTAEESTGAEWWRFEHPTFWNYHTMAARNLEALVHVRQCWDSWLVSSDSTQASSIPLGWVIPVKPSSEPWHLYLDKNP